jgi:hypothetical protein
MGARAPILVESTRSTVRRAPAAMACLISASRSFAQSSPVSSTAVADSADVVVLAQASMAAAAAGLDLGVPVLTSPEGGAAALVGAVRRMPA